jgi:hypothetical protein
LRRRWRIIDQQPLQAFGNALLLGAVLGIAAQKPTAALIVLRYRTARRTVHFKTRQHGYRNGKYGANR